MATTLHLHPVMAADRNKKRLIALALDTDTHPFDLLSGKGAELSPPPKNASRIERSDLGPTGGAA